MPRKSAAALSIVKPVTFTPRPKPLAELTDEQQQVWRDITESMPSDWFPRCCYPLLAQLCRHICEARFIAGKLKKGAPNKTLADYDKWLSMQDRESKIINALSRSLRLTNQSRYAPSTAESKRKAAAASGGSRRVRTSTKRPSGKNPRRSASDSSPAFR
jgi:hypothetical protein